MASITGAKPRHPYAALALLSWSSAADRTSTTLCPRLGVTTTEPAAVLMVMVCGFLALVFGLRRDFTTVDMGPAFPDSMAACSSGGSFDSDRVRDTFDVVMFFVVHAG